MSPLNLGTDARTGASSHCRKTGDQFVPSIYMRGVEPIVLRLAELCKRMQMYTTVPTFILNDYLLESSIHFLLLLPYSARSA